MGYKIIGVLVMWLIVQGSASATGLQIGTAHSADNSGVIVQRNTLSTVGAYSIRAQHTVYNTPTGITSHQALLLGIKQVDGKLQTTGVVGLARGDRLYGVGDITTSYRLNSSWTLHGSAWGDLVDSGGGIAQNITLHGTSMGAEYNHGNIGATGSVRRSWYSDGVVQGGWSGRAWWSTGSGITLYVTHKQHSNSGSSMWYSTPPQYSRSGIGVTGRHNLDGYRVSFNLERSNIATTYTNDSANSWKISVTTPPWRGITVGIQSGKDYSSSLDFSYRYSNATVNILW